MNTIVIIGRLTDSPEVRSTSGGHAVANFTVAVDRPYKDRDTGERKTDFIRCSAWRHTAEFVGKYFEKGSKIVIRGRLEVNNYQKDDGTWVNNTQVLAEEVEFGESKAAAESNRGGQPTQHRQPTRRQEASQAIEPDDNIGLPFDL